jgi:hypothetical protein
VPTYLEFAPESGAGLPVISHHSTALCDALAANVPSWNTAVDGGAGNWCLGGNGLAVPGSEVTFAYVGVPSVVRAPVCPSGLDCLAATGMGIDSLQLTTGTQYTQATAATTNGVDFSFCGWVQHSAPSAANESVFSKEAAGAGGRSVVMLSASTSEQFAVYKSDASSTVVTSAGTVAGIALDCATYRFVTDGTSVMRRYTNGTLVGSSTSAVGPPQKAVASKATVGFGVAYAGLPFFGNVFGAFYVDQELSAAQIAAIARAVLADSPKAIINGRTELALTYSRTGSMFCEREDHTGSIIPANRPCVARDGILAEGQGVNLLLRSQEFENATWTKVGAVITANHAVAPDGTKTAERMVWGAGHYIIQTNPTSGAPTARSIYLKGTSGSGSINLGVGGLGGQCFACAFTSTTWSRCTYFLNSATQSNFIIGPETTTGCSAVGDSSGDVLIWGAQAETGPVATSYIPTTSAAATRGDTSWVIPASYLTGLTVAKPFSMAFTNTPTKVDYSFAGSAGPGFLGTQTVAPSTSGPKVYQCFTNGWYYQVYSGISAIGSGCVSEFPYPIGVEQRLALSFTLPGTLSVWKGGVAMPSFSGTLPAPTSTFGNMLIGNSTGWYSKICLDPHPNRCR